MGGESFYPPPFSAEDESSLTAKFPLASITSSVFSGNEEGLSPKSENCSVFNGDSGLNFGGFQNEGPRLSLVSEATERQRVKVYAEVLRSYEELQSRIDRLEEAKSRILSYTPGAWAEKIDSMDLSECDIPNITSFLLIGPKGSGKSSLINKISRVLENDIFVSGRAQVSWNSSKEEGTYFLHEYVIPRGSGSFCLYDTRSLSDDSSENLNMLQRWMMKGVRHGELVKSVDGKKKEYSQMIATNFNNPLLSFKDDKPIVVITHGDLLSLSDRVRIRVYLGELLGVPPKRQIFDIPESNDSATDLAIVDMLIYCLECADRNLPPKDLFVGKAPYFRCMLSCIVLAMAVVFQVYRFHAHQPWEPTAPSPMQVDWYRIRHLWLG
ncbi:UNVERIFIED_CONTAM: hypothetical protein Scaly_0345300 [Sesamum calycinum]|uniref:G domain-containing protein n=1 Tax=Sesamum calycinum TaxID=2727403 RepID=A0AAW2SBJ3_9LAMI